MGKKDGSNEEAAVANHVSGQSNKPMSAPAHSLPYEEVARELGTDIQNGLTDEEQQKRLAEYGRNEFGETKGVQPVRIFIGQIANSLTLVGHFLIVLQSQNKVAKEACSLLFISNPFLLPIVFSSGP